MMMDDARFSNRRREGTTAVEALLLAVMVSVVLGLLAVGATLVGQEPAELRFSAVDIYVDSADDPLAAYQIELKDPARRVQITGIEGGEHASFEEPPFYDPKAMRKDRVVLAAFSTAADLPGGRTRVARVHFQVRGEAEPTFELRLVTAAKRDGSALEAKVSSDAAPTAGKTGEKPQPIERK